MDIETDVLARKKDYGTVNNDCNVYSNRFIEVTI